MNDFRFYSLFGGPDDGRTVRASSEVPDEVLIPAPLDIDPLFKPEKAEKEEEAIKSHVYMLDHMALRGDYVGYITTRGRRVHI